MDYDRLAALHATAFTTAPAPWTAAQISALAATSHVTLCAEGDGFIMVQVAGDEAEILTLAVAPAARRQGIATRLLSKVSQILAPQEIQFFFLEVASENTGARALYARFGFQEVGRRKGYYSNGQDALILRASVMDLSRNTV